MFTNWVCLFFRKLSPETSLTYKMGYYTFNVQDSYGNKGIVDRVLRIPVQKFVLFLSFRDRKIDQETQSKKFMTIKVVKWAAPSILMPIQLL